MEGRNARIIATPDLENCSSEYTLLGHFPFSLIIFFFLKEGEFASVTVT
jgi:hypothetical protein